MVVGSMPERTTLSPYRVQNQFALYDDVGRPGGVDMHLSTVHITPLITACYANVIALVSHMCYAMGTIYDFWLKEPESTSVATPCKTITISSPRSPPFSRWMDPSVAGPTRPRYEVMRTIGLKDPDQHNPTRGKVDKAHCACPKRNVGRPGLN